MSDQVPGEPTLNAEPEPAPPGQRFFDNIFLLLGLGVAIMIALYTGWGLWEILTLPKATLP